MILYLEGSLWYTVQLVVGQDEMPQVHKALEVWVVQGGEAVGIQVKGVEILEVGEGVWQDLTDGVSAQGQVDLQGQKKQDVAVWIWFILYQVSLYFQEYNKLTLKNWILTPWRLSSVYMDFSVPGMIKFYKYPVFWFVQVNIISQFQIMTYSAFEKSLKETWTWRWQQWQHLTFGVLQKLSFVSQLPVQVRRSNPTLRYQ